MLIIALASFLGMLVPQEWLQPFGALLRRASDVTPERYARLQHILGFFCIYSIGLFILQFWQARTRSARSQNPPRLSEKNQHFLPLSHRFVDYDHFELRSVLLLLTAGLVIRLHFLFQPMAYDEAYSFLNFARFPLIIAIADYNNTNNHPLNTFGMHLCYQIFGQQDWALRLPVFLAGNLLIAVVYGWVRLRFSVFVATVTTSLVASSALLIEYSTNARGYMLLTLAAISLDAGWTNYWRSIHNSTGITPWLSVGLWWWIAALSFILGCWSMPIMIYPTCAIFGWGLLPQPQIHLAERISRTGRFLLATVPVIVLLWSPAYIFRGWLAYQNPFVQPLSWTEYIQRVGPAWAQASAAMSAGPIPPLYLLLGATAGFVLLLVKLYRQQFQPDRSDRLDYKKYLWLLFPFITTAGLMMLQRVTPPPRIFTFLTPWWLLGVAIGLEQWVLLIQNPHWRHRISITLVILYLILATIFYYQRPIAYNEAERIPLLSVPELVKLVNRHYYTSQQKSALTSSSIAFTPDTVLLVPLPCDLPTMYYLHREKITIRVNDMPKPEQPIWLVPDTWGEQIYTNGVVHVDIAILKRQRNWMTIAEFATLKVQSSSRQSK